MKITDIQAREILDSRGNPTVEATVYTKKGMGVAKVPSGASTGVHEALELRDKQKRYGGKGVLKAVKNVESVIAPALKGMDVRKQRLIDDVMIELDGTDNKSKLGANAILAVSLACAHAASDSLSEPLYKYLGGLCKNKKFAQPQPMMNILNGGAHADFRIDVQEFMVLPKANTMAKRVQMGAEIFHALKSILQKEGYTTLVGDEGGYAPALKNNEEAFQVIMKAIKMAGFKPGTQVNIAIDAAASEFYNKKTKKYELKSEGKTLSAHGMIELYQEWMQKYPLVSIEDGLDEDDWDHWVALTKELGKKTMMVGDDLFVTNIKRLQKGIDMGVANTILIKFNQIGSLSETIEAIRLAQKHRYDVIISHRSGETEDTTIADLAVGSGAKYIKTGSLSRSERVAKYNRLMEIEKSW